MGNFCCQQTSNAVTLVAKGSSAYEIEKTSPEEVEILPSEPVDRVGRYVLLRRPRTIAKRRQEPTAASGAAVQIAGDAPHVKRARRWHASFGTFAPATTLRCKLRTAASRRRAVLARLAEEAQVARWLAARPLAQPSQHPATDKFAALRARARAREAAGAVVE